MWRNSLWEAFMDAPIQPTCTLRSWTPSLPSLPQVQQRCWDLERMLRGQALPTPQRARLRSRTATTTTPGCAQPSAMCPMAVTSPRSSQQP